MCVRSNESRAVSFSLWSPTLFHRLAMALWVFLSLNRYPLISLSTWFPLLSVCLNWYCNTKDSVTAHQRTEARMKTENLFGKSKHNDNTSGDKRGWQVWKIIPSIFANDITLKKGYNIPSFTGFVSKCGWCLSRKNALCESPVEPVDYWWALISFVKDGFLLFI